MPVPPISFQAKAFCIYVVNVKRILLILAAITFFATCASACSTFCYGTLFGKNYDWSIGNGLLIVNPANLTKASTIKNGAHWISKYGSITFNQYGREFPSGGMNQVGLVIELMWLDDTKYPRPDARPAVGTLEWIQFQLDNSRTVQEVLQNSETIRIESDIPLHFLAVDAQGGCATIEFLNGRLVSHSGKDLPVHALTNDTYEHSIEAWKEKREPYQNSLARFVRVANMLASAADNSDVDYAFSVLQKVAQPDFTKWSIVYDRKNLRIYFETADNPKRRFIDFADFDFSCTASAKMIDVNGNLEGDLKSKFSDYTAEENRALIFTSYRKVDFLSGIPDATLNQIAHHGEEARCIAERH
jgi:penicillin V acylase-like amidase (Ntn superfamily)